MASFFLRLSDGGRIRMDIKHANNTEEVGHLLESNGRVTGEERGLEHNEVLEPAHDVTVMAAHVVSISEYNDR